MITCIAMLACGFICVGWLFVTIVGAIINAISSLFKKDNVETSYEKSIEVENDNSEWGMLQWKVYTNLLLLFG